MPSDVFWAQSPRLRESLLWLSIAVFNVLNVLKLDCGDGCTTVYIYQNHRTFKKKNAPVGNNMRAPNNQDKLV